MEFSPFGRKQNRRGGFHIRPCPFAAAQTSAGAYRMRPYGIFLSDAIHNLSYLLFLICLQNLPLLRNEQFLKQARGELVAHAADVVGHGTVHALIVGDLHVKVRHQGRFVAQIGRAHV